MILEYITWNIDPEIIKIGRIAIRYYGVFFALSFYLGYVIFSRFYKLEKISPELLDKLTIYMAVGTIVGARLGHCLFYEPQYYLNNPIEILKIWRGGLASHGAAVGIPVAMYLYTRAIKRKFLWIMDRIVIVVALSGFFIRMGNLMNSEIYGIATNNKFGFIFTRDFTDHFDSEKNIKNFHFKRVENDTLVNGKFIPINMEVTFDKKIRDEARIRNYIEHEINYYLPRNINDKERNLFYPQNKPFMYNLSLKNRNYVASILVWGVPKYPTQIFEALSYLLIFIFLLSMYIKNHGKILVGMSFGLFLITLFTARFIIEIIKENQVPFEQSMPLNMGQILSVPLILAGFGIFIYAILKRDLE